MNKKILQDILDKEARFEFARASGGPGGQNVNRRQTKVFARWNFKKTRFLTDEQKSRLRNGLTDKQLDGDELVVKAEEHRTQGQNRTCALKLMMNIVIKGIKKQKKRIEMPYSETKGEELKRLHQKKIRKHTKEIRQKIRPSDL